jgi:hypothetical protein
MQSAAILSSAASLAQPYFRHDLINGAIFDRNVIEHKLCILILFTTFISNISHYKKNSARYWHKCRNVFMQSTRYSWRISINLNFLDRFSKEKKPSHIKLHHNPSNGSRVVPRGRTDMTKLKAAIRSFANSLRTDNMSLHGGLPAKWTTEKLRADIRPK